MKKIITLIKYISELMICLVYALILIGSFAVGFVAFSLSIAIMGTCNYIVGNVDNFGSSGLSWIYIVGAVVILIVVYFKTVTHN